MRPAATLALQERGARWSHAYGESGAWLKHELPGEVRLWPHPGGGRADWSRRGRRLLLNGRPWGADLRGLSGRRLHQWLDNHRHWARWLVLDAQALSLSLAYRLRREPQLGLALVSRRGTTPRLSRLFLLGQRLRALSVSGARLGPPQLRMLARLWGLKALSLAGAQLVGADPGLLGQLSGLRLLDLTDVNLSAVGFLSRLRQLRRLSLAGTPIRDAALRALEPLGRLRALDLSRTAVTDFGVDRLRRLTRLRALDLADTAVTDLGVDLLARLHRLVLLRVGPHLTDVGLAHLVDLRSLEVLALRRNAITDAGLAHLGRLRRLRSLDLAWTSVGDRGLRHLAGCTRLRHLDLARTRVQGSGLRHLARARGLRSLHLGWAPLRKGYRHLLVGLPALRELVVTGTAWAPTPAAAPSAQPGFTPYSAQ